MQEGTIKKGWKKIKLGEILDILTDYHANGSYEKLKENVTLLDHPDYAIMIRTTNFEQENFRDFIYINEHAYNHLVKSKVYEGDIVMNKIANPGSIYLVPNLEGPISLAMNLFLLRFSSTVDQRFMYYSLKFNEDHIKTFANGTATKTIRKDVVRDIEIMIPESIVAQQKIASILTKYDLLRENNNKRIELLEGIVQEIYKEWFVNFKFPGYEKIKMVDSETSFGQIPESWNIVKVEDYIDFIRGVEPGSSNYKGIKEEGFINFIRVGDLGSRNSGIFFDEALSKGKTVNESEVLVSFDGTVGIVRRGLEGSYSTGIRKVVGKVNYLSNEFLYLLFLSENIQLKIKEHAKGTTILHAGESIKYMEFVLAGSEVYVSFSQYINPILNEILILQKQNKNLEKTKNFLSGKIFSGEIDVSELEII